MLQGFQIAAIVIGILAVVGFVGIWVWFPRALMWGFRKEREAADAELGNAESTPEEIEENRKARNAMSRGIVERALAREQALKRGDKPSDEPVVPREYYERNPMYSSHYPPAPAIRTEPSQRHSDEDAPPAY